jgi:hypothetical protein
MTIGIPQNVGLLPETNRRSLDKNKVGVLEIGFPFVIV